MVSMAPDKATVMEAVICLVLIHAMNKVRVIETVIGLTTVIETTVSLVLIHAMNKTTVMEAVIFLVIVHTMNKVRVM
jgi:hypothetical protein